MSVPAAHERPCGASSVRARLCLLGVCLVASGCGDRPERGASTDARQDLVASTASRKAAGSSVRASAAPRRGRRSTVFRVSLGSRATLGRAGSRRRLYVASARGPFQAACVVELETYIERGRPGEVVAASLDPATAKGGRWCRGRYRGRVRYVDTFACPAKGVCRIPRGFQQVGRVVGRFSFRVRWTRGASVAICRMTSLLPRRRCGRRPERVVEALQESAQHSEVARRRAGGSVLLDLGDDLACSVLRPSTAFGET